MISKAIQFTKNKHKLHLDDTGNSYFDVHLSHVANIIKEVAPNDINLICAAYLHDTIEDTDTTYEEILSIFGEDIANLVHEVTQEGKKDSKGFYFPRLKTQRGIILKFADRLSNLSRMESWDEKRKQHYLNKSKFWKSDII